MASTFSPSLRIELIGDGEQSGIWGQTTNTNLGTLIEQAIAGAVSIVMSDANYTLSNFNGVSDESRNQVLLLSGGLSTTRNLVAPSAEKTYIIKNATSGSQSVRIKTSSGTGLLIPSGTTAQVYCDGTEFYPATTGSLGNFTVTGDLSTSGNASFSSNVAVSNVVSANVVSANSVSATVFSGAGTNLTGTGGSFTAGFANVASQANSLATTNYTVVEESGLLKFKYGSTVIATMDSTGNLTAKSDVTAFGSI